jgi:hypothetical protein
VALDAAQVEYVPVTALVKSPLNVRTIPIRRRKSVQWQIPLKPLACCRIWSCITSRMDALLRVKLLSGYC